MNFWIIVILSFSTTAPYDFHPLEQFKELDKYCPNNECVELSVPKTYEFKEKCVASLKEKFNLAKKDSKYFMGRMLLPPEVKLIHDKRFDTYHIEASPDPFFNKKTILKCMYIEVDENAASRIYNNYKSYYK